MVLSLTFAPDPARAAAMNLGMYRELAQSLEHVWEQSAAALAVDQQRKAALLASLYQGIAFPAGIFASYYELVDAIIDGRLDAAQQISDKMCRLPPWPSGQTISVLGSSELGDESSRYLSLLTSEAGFDFGISSPSEDLAALFRRRLIDSLDVLHQALPEMAGEFDAIIREIVIVGGDNTKTMQFDGGSHAQLWGALFLNADLGKDEVALIEVLAHESAHSLLFGFCTHQTLVLNDDGERFGSPLRTDLRPMDGIYHATFVSARMHWAMTRLLESPRLPHADKAKAEQAATLNAANFRAGDAVIAEYGRLTDLGRTLIEGARAYMARAA